MRFSEKETVECFNFYSGPTSRSIGIVKGALVQGQHYKITVKVTAPGYSAGSASIVGTVNYVPYGGICTLDKTSGIPLLEYHCHNVINRVIFHIGPVIGPKLAVLYRGRRPRSNTAERGPVRPRSNTANLGPATGPIRNNLINEFFFL